MDAVLSDEAHPSHWARAAAVPARCAGYDAVRRAIDISASLPFRAASLQYDTIIMTLQRRAPLLENQDLPLPLPLTLDSVRSLDSMAPVGAMRAWQSSATLSNVRKALDCGALVDTDGPLTHSSPMFSIAQTDKSRLIFDLRSLNEYMAKFPFRLETLADLPALACGCRYASKPDLQSAYWQYPVDEALSRALGTSCRELPGRLLRWSCLPFGLSVAPFAFASLTHAFVRAWRECGIVVTAYLDDILILARTLDEHMWAVSVVVEDLIIAGL